MVVAPYPNRPIAKTWIGGHQTMALANAKANFDAEAEYKAIERTLIETPRGRWFLS